MSVPWRPGISVRNFSAVDFYRFHTANLREIEGAMRHVARDLHRSMAQSQRRTVSAYTRLSALLLGTWAECRLQKLLYEPGASGFSEPDRASIRASQSQYDRWLLTIDLAFRKQYNVSSVKLQPPQLPHTPYYRYQAVVAALSTHLRPVIELRNKLAHGQWLYTLTNDELGISVPEMRAVRRENSLTLTLKHNLLRHLVDVIHDLVVSKPTFTRDFDGHFRALESASIDLEKRSFSKYEKQMRDRYIRGQNSKAKRLASPEELQQRIRVRAYEIYLTRGMQDGSAYEDWLKAEAEIG
jgi:hypothetical protein